MPVRSLAVGFLALFFAGSAYATPAALTLTSNIVINTLAAGIVPEGLAFGTDLAGNPEIFVGDKTSNNIFVFTDPGATGNYTVARSFLAPTGKIRSLEILPNGNLLTAGFTAVEEVSSVDGSPIVGGIGFTNGSFSEIEAAVFVNNGSIYLGGEGNNQIVHVDSTGASVDLPGMPGITSFLHGDLNQNGTIDFNSNPDLNENNYDEVSAGAYDPINDILYIADDSSGAGRTRVWAYDRMGNLLAVSDPIFTLFGWGTGATNDPTLPDEALLTECIANTGLPCIDVEGLGIAVIGGVAHLLLAFENEQVVTAVTFSVPEPGTALLLGMGFIGLARFAARKRPA